MLRFSLFLAASALVLINFGCVAVDTSADVPASYAATGSGVKLSDADATAIGKKIWKNECNGTVEGLTSSGM